MAPVPITEDYYMVLEVVQTATPEQITQSYKRLALKLHPDRNDKQDATEAFQRLGRAYETLKDESKRRAYDTLIYPKITRSRPCPQTTQTPRSTPASTPQTGVPSEATQIAALQKSKQERGAQWRTKRNVIDSAIFELQRDVRRLEQEIKILNSIVAAEAAEEAKKNSWGTWFLSPIYKKVEDSEEEKARKDRERQERRIEKDMKERWLASKQTDLKKQESSLQKAKEEVDLADLVDDRKIRAIQDKILARETLKRQEKEKAEREERERVAREQRARMWKQQQEQQEKLQREAAEAMRKQQAEAKAAEQKWQEERARRLQNPFDDEIRNQSYQSQFTHHRHPQAFPSTCYHDGWWPKVQGRTACPKCFEIWTYLLQCPDCNMKACPRCQADIRPPRRNRRPPLRVRTPCPEYGGDFADDYY